MIFCFPLALGDSSAVLEEVLGSGSEEQELTTINFRHFYAHEHPQLLARDLQTMFGKGGGAYVVVEGRTGYDPDAPNIQAVPAPDVKDRLSEVHRLGGTGSNEWVDASGH